MSRWLSAITLSTLMSASYAQSSDLMTTLSQLPDPVAVTMEKLSPMSKPYQIVQKNNRFRSEAVDRIIKQFMEFQSFGDRTSFLFTALQTLGVYDGAFWTTGETINTSQGVAIKGYVSAIDLRQFESEGATLPKLLKFNLTLVLQSDITSATILSSKASAELLKDWEKDSIALLEKQAKLNSLSTFKQLALTLVMLAADNDDRIPIYGSEKEMVDQLMPYAKNSKLFQDLLNGASRVNRNIFGKSLSNFDAPAETPMFYSLKPFADGSRTVAFMDGHCKIVSADTFNRLVSEHNLNVKP